MLICLLECLDIADRIREKAPSTSGGWICLCLLVKWGKLKTEIGRTVRKG